MPRFDRQHLRGYHATRRQCPGLPALLVATLTLAGSPALAQSYTWSGGNGATWDTSAANWTDATGTPWDATAGTTGTATFVATSGSATVDGTVYANRIDYTAASGTFAIRNGTINLAGTTPTISVNPARTFTIGSVLDGSAGLVKTGSGTLVLAGANTYSGPTTSGGGGILRADSQTAFGTGNVSNSDNSTILLSSGTYANNFTVSGADGAQFLGVLAGVANSTTVIDGLVTLPAQAGFGAGSNGTMTLRGGLSGTGVNFFSRSGTIVIDSPGWNVSGLQAGANSTIVVSQTGTASFLVRLNGTGSVIRTDVANAWGAGGWVNFNSGTSGTLNLNGNNQTASHISTTAGLLAAGGTSRVVTSVAPATFTTAQTTSGTFDGIFTGAAALTKAGVSGNATTLTLTGPSTSTGQLTISNGTVALGTSGTGTAVQVGEWAGDVDIASAAALIGEGSVGGLASVAGGGILAPGVTTIPGTLALSGGLALAPTSILRFDLNATDTTVGSGINDLINVTGNFTLGGTLDVTAIGDFTTAGSGSVWRLFNYSGGSFDGSLTLGSLPTLADGLAFTIDTATPGQVNLSVVPEPSALLLAGLGIAAALGAVRRQRPLVPSNDR